MKKLLAFAVSALVSVSALTQTGASLLTNEKTVSAASSSYNYGEALQKAMFFYQVQQCGELPEWNEVSWRDDCMVNDYVPGGWFDAGDHLKFTLTNAYSATLLGWGYLQYEEGVKACGEVEEYKNNLSWALDYLVDCDLGDEIVYMIGDGGFDHVWWGSAEVYMEKFKLMKSLDERPYYTCNDSCIESQMAAALAVGYLCFKDSDAKRANEYLKHAKACFERADKNRSIGDDPMETSYYKISSFYDDLFFAANWLYRATGEQSYLDLCKSDYIPNLGKEEQSTEMKFTWGYCWDDVQQAGTLLYAMNTGDSTWKDQFKKHLEYWTTGYGGKKINYTPDGLAWLFNWGALRHSTTTAFLAYVAVDEIFADDSAAVKKYTDFADSQMNYCFGDNAKDFSYVVGMGDTYPQAWHHRTSSGAWNDKWGGIGQTEGEDAKPHAHTLYGALVGGPNQNGQYSDVISQYEYTEVAIDYNAGFTAALCGMVEKYGGSSDPSFPPTETPKWDEFYIEACINQASPSFTEIKVQTTNHSAWPARTIKNLSYNYYMDFTELFDAGLTVDDVSVRIGSQEWSGNCSISQPIQYDGNIYYVKISYSDGTMIMPTGQSEHQGEVQFRVSIPDPKPVWNAENDYSFEGLKSNDLIKTDKITLYDGETLIWGTEPDGTTPVQTTTEKPVVSKLKGDMNLDGIFAISDLVTLNAYLINSSDKTASTQGGINADMDENGVLNIFDSVLMRKKL